MSDTALAPRGDNRLLALVVAVMLHAGVLALVIFTPGKAPEPIGSSVPINIVASAPTDVRPAIEAPRTQAAAAPAPVPQAPPQPPAPVVAPTPAFSRPAPEPKPATPHPAPVQSSIRPAPPPTPAVDFNRLQQIIDNARRQTGPAASSAAHGPPRAETAPAPRPDAGKQLSQSDLLGLQQLLERLWNPNCDVAGGASVKLQVKFTVDLTGGLLGRPTAGGLERSSDPVVAAAARRALDAVQEAAPYSQPYYGQSITVNFDAKEACAKR